MTPYDAVEYPTHPKRHTSPTHVAALARLFGFQPAPPAGCRVLEIGCGDGGNLIAMAATLPEAEFVGIDLASTAIARGKEALAVLGWRHVRLEARDLTTARDDLGKYDYIVVHGVYSWVPGPVRDSLLAACGELLTPHGIAFVSYNCLPGCHIRNLYRDIKRYHARHFDDPGRQIEQARAIMQFMAGAAHGDTYRALMREEAEKIAQRPAGAVYHDDLAEINHPMLFTDFLQHAAAHGLQYLAEAEFSTMHDAKNQFAGIPDFIEREQYLDFLRGRSFRQTLLCREGVTLERPARPGNLRELWFSSHAKVTRDNGETRYGLEDGSIFTAHPAADALLATLASAWPVWLSLPELLCRTGVQDESFTCEVLLGGLTGGILDVHATEAPFTLSPGERPRTSALVRLEAGRGNRVSTLAMTSVRFEDDLTPRLLTLLDGTRDRTALLQAMDIPATRSAELETTLDGLARAALLV